MPNTEPGHVIDGGSTEVISLEQGQSVVRCRTRIYSRPQMIHVRRHKCHIGMQCLLLSMFVVCHVHGTLLPSAGSSCESSVERPFSKSKESCSYNGISSSGRKSGSCTLTVEIQHALREYQSSVGGLSSLVLPVFDAHSLYTLVQDQRL